MNSRRRSVDPELGLILVRPINQCYVTASHDRCAFCIGLEPVLNRHMNRTTIAGEISLFAELNTLLFERSH
jgi:hypothetical protein